MVAPKAVYCEAELMGIGSAEQTVDTRAYEMAGHRAFQMAELKVEWMAVWKDWKVVKKGNYSVHGLESVWAVPKVLS